jgi:hypothetical protein
VPLTYFRCRRCFVLIIATLIVPMSGVPAYPQHSHRAAKPASSDPAWNELQQSMRSMPCSKARRLSKYTQMLKAQRREQMSS